VETDESILLPTGAISVDNGSIEYPDGSKRVLESSVEVYELPDGTTMPKLRVPAGACELADGTVLFENGTVQYPTGSTLSIQNVYTSSGCGSKTLLWAADDLSKFDFSKYLKLVVTPTISEVCVHRTR
jgi:hypothetical protein